MPSPSLSNFLMSAPSCCGVSLRLKTRLSCSLKTCGCIAPPSNASSETALAELLSYLAAALVIIAHAVSRSLSVMFSKSTCFFCHVVAACSFASIFLRAFSAASTSACRRRFTSSERFAKPDLKNWIRNSWQLTVRSPSLSMKHTSAPSSSGLSLMPNTRLSCSLKTCGVMSAPSKPSSPIDDDEFLSYRIAARVILPSALLRSSSVKS